VKFNSAVQNVAVCSRFKQFV